VVLALFAATWNLSSHLGAVRHSHEVIDEIMAVRAATRQSREALHRYLQESDAAQKPIYKAETESAWHSVWRVKEMTLDSPRQKANAALFEQEVGDTFKLTNALLAEKDAGRLRRIEERVEAEERVNDKFRLAVGAIIDEERRILAEREERLSGALRLVQLCAVACALGFLFFGYRVWSKL
jgi:hypothetical protein